MASEDVAVKACVDPLFVGLGPLRSFWAKTQLARALGFIDHWMYDDLERIRNLRNLFAHSYENADFADPRVIALTERLVGADKAVQEMEKTPPPESVVPNQMLKDTPVKHREVMKKERMRFIMAASYIGGNIHGRSVPPEAKAK
jgi:DNA-binding MltR family transcriptional regulator